jgi:hypothetical protein
MAGFLPGGCAIEANFEAFWNHVLTQMEGFLAEREPKTWDQKRCEV